MAAKRNQQRGQGQHAEADDARTERFGAALKEYGIQLHIGVEPALARSIRHTAFEVADVEAARYLLERNDIEIIEEPKIPGRSRFAFIDPFGNRMELLQMIDL